MDAIHRELLKAIHEWRERNDLRPSEVVAHLIDAALGLAPTKHEDIIADVRVKWAERFPVEKPKS